MNDSDLERLECKIAFLEKANTDLSDVVYAQHAEMRALVVRLTVLAERFEAMQSSERERSPDDERPPHY